MDLCKLGHKKGFFLWSRPSEVQWRNGNIDAAPRFVEPGYWADINDPNIVLEPNDPNAIWVEGNYHLLPASLCIDAGDNSAVPAGVTRDVEGELRFVDDAAVADTGSGTAPIVDMGAHEYSCCGGPRNGRTHSATSIGTTTLISLTLPYLPPTGWLAFRIDYFLLTIDYFEIAPAPIGFF